MPRPSFDFRVVAPSHMRPGLGSGCLKISMTMTKEIKTHRPRGKSKEFSQIHADGPIDVSRSILRRACHSISCIHGCPPTLVHLCLLLSQRSKLLFQLPAFRYHASLSAALTCMDLQQGPDATTNSTSALYTCQACSAVFQEILHLVAVGRWALFISTA